MNILESMEVGEEFAEQKLHKVWVKPPYAGDNYSASDVTVVAVFVELATVPKIPMVLIVIDPPYASRLQQHTTLY